MCQRSGDHAIAQLSRRGHGPGPAAHRASASVRFAACARASEGFSFTLPAFFAAASSSTGFAGAAEADAAEEEEAAEAFAAVDAAS